MAYNYTKLNSENAFIWRITHRQNLPWIFENGLHAANSLVKADNWITIGNEELIDRRSGRIVPLRPGGSLNDYIPFYFTPFSTMMLNVITGRGGVRRVQQNDIVILVSKMTQIARLELPFVFTDRHAYVPKARYFNELESLEQVDWPLLQQRDFKRDPDDPQKIERYQAEALIYQQMPIHSLLGVVCYNQVTQQELQKQAAELSVQLDIRSIPGWYF